MDRERALRTAYVLERTQIDRDTTLTFYSRAVALRRLHGRFVAGLAEIRRQSREKGVPHEGLQGMQLGVAR